MLAQGSLKPISILITPVIVFITFGYLLWYPSYYLAILFFIIFLSSFIFFRDPSRTIGKGIVSSADGKVVLIDKKLNRFDVFMNLTNVHVNRAPFGGLVKKTEMIDGNFKPAFLDSSDNNFKHKIVLDTELGEITIHQITGFFARRIVPYIKEGDKINKGDRIGLIRFGSRVRIDLPENIKMTVNEGDIVKSGESTVGVWNED
ncbi:MAG: phosphatidylserine decarboxylase [Candidatus Saliniplasma sp.]